MLARSLSRWPHKLLPYVFLPVSLPRHLLQPAVRILMYHRVARLPTYDQLTVSPERFEEQLLMLTKRWRVISLGSAMAELENDALNQSAVVVTFDDGYRDNITHALPLLRKYAVPATIFVTSRFCDQKLRHPRYPDEVGQLHLDWDEVVTLSKEPGISIGSHTLSHPYLSRLDDRSAHREITQSREVISERIGSGVDYFCYPSGDVTVRERGMVAAAGYRAAVSVRPGANPDISERYSLRRTEVTERDGAQELSLKLVGAYDALHGALHYRRERDFARARAATRQGASPR